MRQPPGILSWSINFTISRRGRRLGIDYERSSEVCGFSQRGHGTSDICPVHRFSAIAESISPANRNQPQPSHRPEARHPAILKRPRAGHRKRIVPSIRFPIAWLPGRRPVNPVECLSLYRTRGRDDLRLGCVRGLTSATRFRPMYPRDAGATRHEFIPVPGLCYAGFSSRHDAV